MRHRIAGLLCSVALLLPLAAQAMTLTYLAAMGSKAMINIDGQRVLLAVGQTVQNVRLVNLTPDIATVVINGQQRQLRLGEGYRPADAGNDKLILSPDARGMYFTSLSVGDASVRAMIDTGASYLTLTRSMADHLHINYQRGLPSATQTANGVVRTWMVTVPTIRLDTVTLNNVSAAVLDTDNSPMALIGMSVMAQFDVRRENNLMLLTRMH
ncbi:aspartyl protease family protein [Silvimonas terrae]|uniref:Aspartyl protease family protein n=1 Tax=Silvimonas terrae TaxID=300266 RepID=A0A840RHD9_9NEIS|nr:retropepsin-like aspartic protease [Silvimonas terrae]MBB5191850.1 aspartyl protease family protein [Silvimonas terrae]